MSKKMGLIIHFCSFVLICSSKSIVTVKCIHNKWFINKAYQQSVRVMESVA